MDYSLIIGIVRRHFEVAHAENVLGVVGDDDDANDYNPSSGPAMSTATVSEGPLSLVLRQFSGEGIRMEDFLRTGLNAEIVEAPGTYYIGIIDALQEWNWSKKLERFYKVRILGQDPNGLSAIEPRRYQSRFMQRAVVDVFDGLDQLPRNIDPGSGNRNSTNRGSGNRHSANLRQNGSTQTPAPRNERYLTLADNHSQSML